MSREILPLGLLRVVRDLADRHRSLAMLVVMLCLALGTWGGWRIGEQLGVVGDWKSRWVRGIPCSAPCWEGLTPGQTTWDEAVEILKHNPIVTNVRLWKSPLGREVDSVAWDWAAPEWRHRRGKNTPWGYALFDPSAATPVIYHIDVDYPSEDLHLGEIIASYGEPTYVAAWMSFHPKGRDTGAYSIYYVDFVFLDHGILLGYGSEEKPDITTGIQVGLESISSPELDAIGPDVGEGLSRYYGAVRWEGYKSFDYYCKRLIEHYPPALGSSEPLCEPLQK